MRSTPPAAPRRRRVRPLTAGLVVVVVALTAMWVYAFGFAPRSYRLAVHDDAWVERAEAICARYARQIEALPSADEFAEIEPRAEALRQRADVLDEANALVAEQVDALAALEPPDNERGRRFVERWLADWDLYLADRHEQGQKWRSGIDEPFTVTAGEGGAPITVDMDSFATNNRMESCVVPGDL